MNARTHKIYQNIIYVYIYTYIYLQITNISYIIYHISDICAQSKQMKESQSVPFLEAAKLFRSETFCMFHSRENKCSNCSLIIEEPTSMTREAQCMRAFHTIRNPLPSGLLSSQYLQDSPLRQKLTSTESIINM